MIHYISVLKFLILLYRSPLVLTMLNEEKGNKSLWGEYIKEQYTPSMLVNQHSFALGQHGSGLLLCNGNPK